MSLMLVPLLSKLGGWCVQTHPAVWLPRYDVLWLLAVSPRPAIVRAISFLGFYLWKAFPFGFPFLLQRSELKTRYSYTNWHYSSCVTVERSSLVRLAKTEGRTVPSGMPHLSLCLSPHLSAATPFTAPTQSKHACSSVSLLGSPPLTRTLMGHMCSMCSHMAGKCLLTRRLPLALLKYKFGFLFAGCCVNVKAALHI